MEDGRVRGNRGEGGRESDRKRGKDRKSKGERKGGNKKEERYREKGEGGKGRRKELIKSIHNGIKYTHI